MEKMSKFGLKKYTSINKIFISETKNKEQK